jgi:hypothetical protein
VAVHEGSDVAKVGFLFGVCRLVASQVFAEIGHARLRGR